MKDVPATSERRDRFVTHEAVGIGDEPDADDFGHGRQFFVFVSGTE
ncbi:MAG: hypothetical protein ACREDY_29190 [Bradyrhizobium sp.]